MKDQTFVSTLQNYFFFNLNQLLAETKTGIFGASPQTFWPLCCQGYIIINIVTGCSGLLLYLPENLSQLPGVDMGQL